MLRSMGHSKYIQFESNEYMIFLIHTLGEKDDRINNIKTREFGKKQRVCHMKFRLTKHMENSDKSNFCNNTKTKVKVEN